MERYLKQQLIMSKITSILIKGGLSSAGAYNSVSTDMIHWILAFAFFFNILYAVCSIFQFCLNVTRNYIIATVVFIGSLWVMFSNADKVDDNTAIVFILCMFLFFVIDIIGLIKLILIPVD